VVLGDSPLWGVVGAQSPAAAAQLSLRRNTHVEHQFEVLDGEYLLVLDHCDDQTMIGHVYHVYRSGQDGFGTVQTPVAYVSAHIAPGGELYREHWSIYLFFRSDVRYQQSSRTTTVVASPERQAGQNRRLLKRLLSLRDSSLPLYHPELPRSIGRVLLDAQLCHEPLTVQIEHSSTDSVVAFGAITQSD
jgi:hypothetical protein